MRPRNTSSAGCITTSALGKYIVPARPPPHAPHHPPSPPPHPAPPGPPLPRRSGEAGENLAHALFRPLPGERFGGTEHSRPEEAQRQGGNGHHAQHERRPYEGQPGTETSQKFVHICQSLLSWRVHSGIRRNDGFPKGQLRNSYPYWAILQPSFPRKRESEDNKANPAPLHPELVEG